MQSSTTSVLFPLIASIICISKCYLQSSHNICDPSLDIIGLRDLCAPIVLSMQPYNYANSSQTPYFYSHYLSKPIDTYVKAFLFSARQIEQCQEYDLMQSRAVPYVFKIFEFYCSFFLFCTYHSILTIKPTYPLCNTPDSVSPHHSDLTLSEMLSYY